MVMVENNLNLLTLPPMTRDLGIRREGNAANRLGQLLWLHANRVLYWGDIDVEGLTILSRHRNLIPHLESLHMDSDTLREHETLLIDGSGSTAKAPTNLKPRESESFTISVF